MERYMEDDTDTNAIIDLGSMLAICWRSQMPKPPLMECATWQ